MRFRYLRDPLFITAIILYFLNRFLLKVAFPVGFFRDHLNDLICIPFWVPIMLFTERKLGLREADVPPQWYEILIPLVMWSFVFELWLPRIGYFQHLAISDPFDILWYTIGAAVAASFWAHCYRRPSGNNQPNRHKGMGATS
jgi:hypothetical protein